ncbi:MAG: uroporphyrinogen-III C-methyltransferase [Sedimentisphaerales bacterium]|jgi:uroporphyrinogen III methyltransferase/synthase
MNRKSKVYIVGAGPGSAGFISVRGLQILQQADCVIYDRLIGNELLNLIPQKAQLVYVGKDHSENSLGQDEINQIIVEKTQIYKKIVRLKGGDPMIFGRASEELKCLTDNKIDFEIIPGITAASAAAASCGVVLTDRNTASSVTYITGQAAACGEHGRTNGKETDIDFASLVKLNGTIVFYMAVKNMDKICQRLITAGLAPDTNAFVVANACLANQRIVKGTVSDIAEKCTDEKIEPPAVLIIGKDCFSWFEKLPLFGKRILITRDSDGNAELACKLAARGARAIEYPAFKIQDLTDSEEFKGAVKEITNFDWVFFTSPRGVKLFFAALDKLNKDARVFGAAKIACIGSQTAAELDNFGIKADFTPEIFTSVEFAKSFIKEHNPAGKKILLSRSALANNELTEKLIAAGAKVTQVSIYSAEKIKNDVSSLARQFKADEIDWITFASSFAVKCFFEDFDSKGLRKVKIASIGPTTTDTLKKNGITPAVEPAEHTIDGLIDAMENAK